MDADTLVDLKGGPPSPSNSTTSSSVSVPSLPNTPFGQPSSGHRRRPSDQHVIQKLKPPLNLEDDVDQASRRNSMPGRLRRASFSTNDRRNLPGDAWHQRRQTSGYSEHTPASSVSSPSSSKVPLPHQLEGSDAEKKASPKLSSLPAGIPSEKTVDCLIAEDSKCDLSYGYGRTADCPFPAQTRFRAKYWRPSLCGWAVCALSYTTARKRFDARWARSHSMSSSWTCSCQFVSAGGFTAAGGESGD